MDFTKLRATALKDGDDEEAVTVNTRALIDKVLARYSGEWTTLRELIQNAADAQATKVTIKFETLPSAQVSLSNTTNRSDVLKHVLLNHTLRRLLVTNDGQAFGVNDWSRLKRIAEGNPDETKIGAFGVGFYSVFADCEEPFVTSGNEAMAFYWKGNSLFTRRLQLPTEQGSSNTSFVLDYRNTTTPMPNLLSIAQFLATSLTFVSLENIELWVDDYKIVSLQKKAAPSISVPIARDVETKTKEGLMKVHSLERQSVQMDATFMNVVGWKPSISTSVSKTGSSDSGYGTNSDVPSLRSFFSRLTSSSTHTNLKTKAMREESAFQDVVLEDLTAVTTANVFLRVTTAVVKTSINASFAVELERATKKPPPKTTKLAILTSSYDETVASSKENTIAKNVDIFASVLPRKKPGGRIFIGFPTHQTTGAGMHLSAPSVIPTVERESIDLNARWVRTWNIEMLRVAGIMARLAFSNEMGDLSAKVKRACELAGRANKITKAEITQFMAEAAHTLSTFTFSESTPSSQVSQIIEEAFWTAYKKPSIEIYSTQGVLPTTKVRLATEDLSGFVEGIPVVPQELANGAFVLKLRDFGIITEITIEDVKQELGAKALNQTQLIQFISWAGRKAITGDIAGGTVQSLLDVAIAMTGDLDGQGDIIALGSIKNYMTVNKIPADVPTPPTTIPFKFTKNSNFDELRALGWTPLEIVPWLRFLIETNLTRPAEQNLETSVKFAGHVLTILSKAWQELSAASKEDVVTLLRNVTIVPTKVGMRRPGDAYFPSVKLFDDLPTVSPINGVKEKFLDTIGVRKTVDLETIFSRLLAPATQTETGGKSSSKRHMELVKYLASVRDDIPAADLKRLRASQICPAEAGPKGMESTQGTLRLYRVSELYEPHSSLRDLGLPILQWAGPPGSYRSGSAEGRFMTLLGIRAFPSVPELIEMMSSIDLILREKSMTYFIANHHINGYAAFDVSATPTSFLPLQGDEKRLVSPAGCFTNPACALLGFNILKQELQIHANKFGVATDPPMTQCVSRLLAKPPQSHKDATLLFKYFASRLGELGTNSVAKIADSPIVPVVSQKKTSNSLSNEKVAGQGDLRHLTPRQCYLGSSETYNDIFDFVDFGNEGNAFLQKCGSKNEPTKAELAALACKEPARLLGVMQSPEKYLNMLRSLADDLPNLKSNRVLFRQMRQSKFLLGSVDIPSVDEKNSSQKDGAADGSDNEDFEEASIKQYQLALPSQIVVVDDYNSYRLFKQSLICAPMDDKLEEFYLALGAETLSGLVQDELRVGGVADKQGAGVKLRIHVLERSKIFLHEYHNKDIRNDARWLEKHLSLQIVSSITLRRSLRGHSLSHTEKRSAACTNDSKGSTLFIANGTNDTFQISQAICKLLLVRPNQAAFLTFESFLNLNLLQLRARGYNVERILRAKAAEARVAEEERKKQMETEQQHIREQEARWRAQNQHMPTPVHEDNLKPTQQPMPGTFGSESSEGSPEAPSKSKSKGWGPFAGLTKRLGLDRDGEAHQHLQNFLGNGGGPSQGQKPQHDAPPSYDEAEGNHGGKKTSANGAGNGKISSPHGVQQDLLNAIRASRAHDSSALFTAPSAKHVKDQESYCDATSGKNITFLADSANGTRIFVSKTLDSPTAFLSQNVAALNSFAVLLHETADIYNLPRKAVHIFFDENGGTIAFNFQGSIFFNFRFFSELHERTMQGQGRIEAAAYWWVVMAHELAHNLVEAHNSEHSFYTESLIANYFTKMMAKVAGSPNQSLPPPPGPSSGRQNSTQQPSLLD